MFNNKIALLTCSLFLIFISSIHADEIKTKDYQNTSMDSDKNSNSNTPSLSPEQMADLQKQVQKINERQEESNKALQELEKDVD